MIVPWKVFLNKNGCAEKNDLLKSLVRIKASQRRGMRLICFCWEILRKQKLQTGACLMLRNRSSYKYNSVVIYVYNCIYI